MMATIRLAGRDFDIAPYKLREMIAAAPILDAQKARNAAIEARAGVTFAASDSEEQLSEKLGKFLHAVTESETIANICDTLRVLHIGIHKIAPDTTFDALLDTVEATPAIYAQLLHAMNDVLGRSGMQQGEAAAPSAPPPQGA